MNKSGSQGGECQGHFGTLFENKFVLCPQMDKASDVNLMYILTSLKCIRITLTVGKSWALL